MTVAEALAELAALRELVQDLTDEVAELVAVVPCSCPAGHREDAGRCPWNRELHR